MTVTGVIRDNYWSDVIVDVTETGVRRDLQGHRTLGHHVNNVMIIPPRASRHDIYGKCGGVCTSQVRIILFEHNKVPFVYGMHTHHKALCTLLS